MNSTNPTFTTAALQTLTMYLSTEALLNCARKLRGRSLKDGQTKFACELLEIAEMMQVEYYKRRRMAI